MSSSKQFAICIWPIVWTCATAFFYSTSFQRNGIYSISAHCMSGANMHDRFHRNFNQTYTLSAEQTVTAFLRKGQNARFAVHLEHTSPLTIALNVKQAGTIIPQLFYNASLDLSKFFFNNVTSVFNIPCALSGKYDVLVKSNGNTQVNVNMSLQKPFLAQKLLNYVQTSRIRYENHVHKRQTTFKWDKSKLDIHAVQYCLVMNAHSNQDTFCDAVDQINRKNLKMTCSRFKEAINMHLFQPVYRISDIDSKYGTALACTGLRNRHTLTGMVTNKKYFVDVFGIHKMVPGLIFKLASTSFVFNGTTPVELHEDQTEIGKITEFDKRTTFVFKPNKTKGSAKFMIMIIPSQPVKVKVTTLKKLKKALNITSAAILKFNNPRQTEYTLKFSPSLDDCAKKRSFKLVATTNSNFSNYPMLPSDMLVMEVSSLSTCTESTIMWHSSPDTRPVTYCVSAIKIKVNKPSDFIASSSTCDAEKFKNKIQPNQKYDCITSSPNSSATKKMERFKLENLSPNHGYIIQVTLKLQKESIPYQTLKIFKSHHCFKRTLNKSEVPRTQLRHQHLEDNHIQM